MMAHAQHVTRANSPVERVLEALAARQKRVKPQSGYYMAQCPAHDDSDPSLSITEGDDGRALLRCHAGCSFGDIMAALGLAGSAAFPDHAASRPVSSTSRRQDTVPGEKATLARLVGKKRLPVEFLRDTLGWRERDRGVAIPYHNRDGALFRWRLREDMTGRTKWDSRTDMGTTVYGADWLAGAADSEVPLAVEGETDAATARYHGILAFGVPGASMVKSSVTPEDIAKFPRLDIWQEPDDAGAHFIDHWREHLAALGYRGEARVVVPPAGVKDLSDLYCRDPEGFVAALRELRQGAVPLMPTLDEQGRAIPTPVTLRVYTDDELVALPPQTWLVDGLLHLDSLAVLSGHPGTYKSFLALDLSLSVAAGMSWAGRAVTEGPAFYIAAEGSGGLNKRVRAWRSARDRGSVPIFFLLEPADFLHRRNIDEVLGAIGALPAPPVLIVVDTLSQSMVGGEENSSADMTQFISACNRLRIATGACVLVLHHVTKGTGTIRGHSSLLAALNTHLEVVRRGDDTVALSFNKQKDDQKSPTINFAARKVELDEGETSLVLQPTDTVVVGGRGAMQRALTGNLRTAIEALQRLGGSSPAAKWHEASGLAESSFYRAVKQAEVEGHVRRDGPNRGGVYVLTEGVVCGAGRATPSQTLTPPPSSSPESDYSLLPSSHTPLGVGGGSGDGSQVGCADEDTVITTAQREPYPLVMTRVGEEVEWTVAI